MTEVHTRPIDLRPLGDRLREDTRDLHTRAEKGPLQAALVKGQLPREQYADMLEQMLLVHRSLEDAIERVRPGVAALDRIVTREQYQVPYLEADLAFYGRSGEGIAPVPATSAVIERIERVASERPIGLLGLHYVLEGSNNGNRFIAKAVRHAYALEGDEGLRYLLPYGERQPEVWAGFKTELAACEFSNAEMDAIVSCAKDMFGAIIGIHDQLHERAAAG
ncbi:MAG: biliverdin-producing heme oxygenase [Phycisphaerales bacterium JB037]